jgi:hypothetical protein
MYGSRVRMTHAQRAEYIALGPCLEVASQSELDTPVNTCHAWSDGRYQL